MKTVPMIYRNMVFVFTLFSLLTSCSGIRPLENTSGSDAQDPTDGRPAWIYSPQKICSESELCASGEGESFKLADMSAYKSLGAIFEVNIKSQLSVYKAELPAGSAENMEEELKMSINQSVDQMIQGAEVKDRYEQNGVFFSLVVLDKFQAQSNFRQALDTLDSELEFLVKESRKSSFPKALMLFEKRNRLAARMSVLTGAPEPSPYSAQDILNLKYANPNINKVKLGFNADTPLTMRAKLEEVLLESGYEVTTSTAMNYKVQIDFSADKEFLNVQGFEKFRFSIRASAFDNLGEKLGGVVISEVSQGRNKSDAFLKVRSQLQEKFKSQFNKLNLK